MFQALGKDPKTGKIIMECDESDLDAVAHTADGAIVTMVEIQDSETWGQMNPQEIGLHVTKLVSVYGSTLVGLEIRAGETWIVKVVVTNREILFPNGILPAKIQGEQSEG